MWHRIVSFFKAVKWREPNSVLLALILLGVILRLREYIFARSIWLDEAALLHQIISRSFAELLTGGIGGNQGAPTGFTVTTKLFLNAFGSTDYSARLLPFVAGIMLLPVMYWLGKLVLPGIRSQAVLLFFTATSPILIYYSAEAKQYELETFTSALMLCLCLADAQEARSTRTLAAIGAIAVWFSYSVVFVLAGCGTVSLWRLARQKRHAELLQYCGIIAVWLLSFLGHFYCSAAGLLGNKALHAYWHAGFAPLDDGVLATVMWVGRTLFDYVEYALALETFEPYEVLGRILTGLACLLAIIGAAALLRQRNSAALPLLLIPALAVAAATLGIVPFRGRLTLYLMPMVVLLIAAAVDDVRMKAPSISAGWNITRLNAMSALAVMMLAVVPVSLSVTNLITPLNEHDLKGALSFVKHQRSPLDAAVVEEIDRAAYIFYKMKYRLDDLEILESGLGFGKRSTARIIRQHFLDQPERRIWVIAAYRAAVSMNLLQVLQQQGFVIEKKRITPYSIAALVAMGNARR